LVAGSRYDELNNGTLVRTFKKMLTALVGEAAPEKFANFFQDISYVESVILTKCFRLEQLPLRATTIYEARNRL